MAPLWPAGPSDAFGGPRLLLPTVALVVATRGHQIPTFSLPNTPCVSGRFGWEWGKNVMAAEL